MRPIIKRILTVVTFERWVVVTEDDEKPANVETVIVHADPCGALKHRPDDPLATEDDPPHTEGDRL